MVICDILYLSFFTESLFLSFDSNAKIFISVMINWYRKLQRKYSLFIFIPYIIRHMSPSYSYTKITMSEHIPLIFQK